MKKNIAPTKVGKVLGGNHLSHMLKHVAKNLNCFPDTRRDTFIGVSSVAKKLTSKIVTPCFNMGNNETHPDPLCHFSGTNNKHPK